MIVKKLLVVAMMMTRAASLAAAKDLPILAVLVRLLETPENKKIRPRKMTPRKFQVKIPQRKRVTQKT